MGLEERAHHPMGEKTTGGSKMILTGKMHQVTIKKTEEDVTGIMDPIREHCSSHLAQKGTFRVLLLRYISSAYYNF